jgi:hypothetical protein
MRKKQQQEQKSGPRLYPDMKPEEGQITFVPADNRLLEMKPYLNRITRPEWLKELDEQASIHRCAGVFDYLRQGVTVPLWTDVDFRPDQNNQDWEWSIAQYVDRPQVNIQASSLQSPMFQNVPFGFDSTGSCPVTSVRKLQQASYPKLATPWAVITPPGWSVLLMPLVYEPNPNYTVLPGIVNTDYYHIVNVLMNITTDQPFSIKYGTPMIHLIPFKRDSDFAEIIFEDESMYKHCASRGMSPGPFIPNDAPTKSASLYRSMRRHYDKTM